MLIERIRMYILIFNTRCHLDLENRLYVPKCARNLVYVGRLDDVGFNFKIENNVFSLYKHKYYYGSSALIDCLYRFNLDVNFFESLFHVEHSIGNKHSAHNECSTFLYHQRLGHISKERALRLIKSGILPQLDFVDKDVCMDCIKGKQTRHISKKPTIRSNELLELIHTDIYCSRGEKYFITFINDFLRYCYLFLLYEKSQSVDILEVSIYEVEMQLDRKVKVIRFDRGVDYYGKFNEKGQCLSPFAKFLENRGKSA